jgi:hypothetical protein
MGPTQDRPPAYRLVFLAVILGLSGALLTGGCGVFFGAQGRYLLDQKNRIDLPGRYEPLTFQAFVALPGLSADYTATDWDVVRALSGRGVSLEGYIAEVRQLHDGLNYGRLPWNGDLHVHVRDQPQPGCFPGGARRTQIVTEVTPPFQPPKTGWSLEALRDLCERQVRVRVSGWLLHDFQHLDGVGRWHASAWEIHPTTKIEVWEPERHVWRPLP